MFVLVSMTMLNWVSTSYQPKFQTLNAAGWKLPYHTEALNQLLLKMGAAKERLCKHVHPNLRVDTALRCRVDVGHRTVRRNNKGECCKFCNVGCSCVSVQIPNINASASSSSGLLRKLPLRGRRITENWVCVSGLLLVCPHHRVRQHNSCYEAGEPFANCEAVSSKIVLMEICIPPAFRLVCNTVFA